MCVGSTMSGPMGVNTAPNNHCSCHRLKYILIRVSMQLIISGCKGVLSAMSGKLSDAIVRPQFQLKIIYDIVKNMHRPNGSSCTAICIASLIGYNYAHARKLMTI